MYRGTTSFDRYQSLVETGVLSDFTYDSIQIREPLLEHVGHLPVIASFLYPHIGHHEEVDLGRVLTMLSIHDFGETIVGDVFALHKTQQQEDAETKAVEKHMHEWFLPWFEEFEARQSVDAKYAKSVDSMAPILHELLLPKATGERFKHFNFNTEKVIAKKAKDFEWDNVLSDLFDEMMTRYRKIEEQYLK